MLNLKERAISNERFVGMSVNDIFNFKREVISKYVILEKDIFGEEIDVNDKDTYNLLILRKASNIESDLLGIINSKVKKHDKDFVISSLDKPAVQQIVSFYCEKALNELIDYTKSLCSEEEFKLLEKTQMYSELNSLMKSVEEEIEVPKDVILINEVDTLIGTINKSIEEAKQEIKSSFELSQDEIQNIKEGEKAAEKFKEQYIKNKEKKVSDSANFTKPQHDNIPVMDAEYEDVKVDRDKQELLNMVEDCTKYYYNGSRVQSMIGGQTSILKNVMDNILVYCDKMEKLVEELYGKEPTNVIKGKLSNMQIELAKMICAYNPNNKNDMNTIINSFKAIQVDNDGNPIVYEDFFGNTINANDIKSNNQPKSQNKPKVSSELLAKYPEIIPIISKITQTGVEVSISEITTGYKNNPVVTVIRVDLSVNGESLNKPLLIDTRAALFNDINKVILLPQSEIVEDSIVIDLNNDTIIQRYIYGNISKEEILKYNIISDEIRILSRVVDLSSMSSKQRKSIVDILLQEPSKQLLNDAVNFDEEVRFKLTKWVAEDEFELLSNSSVKSSFLGTTCKRKKQIIKFNKGELSIIR